MTFNPNAGSLSGSSDVGLSAPSDNQLIGYDAAIGKWTNRAPAITAVAGLQAALDAKAATASLGSPVLALPKGDAVPAGTPSGTVIVRYLA